MAGKRSIIGVFVIECLLIFFCLDNMLYTTALGQSVPTTPPILRIGSFGVYPEIIVNPELVSNREGRTPSTGAWIIAQALTSDGGIERVRLEGIVEITCTISIEFSGLAPIPVKLAQPILVEILGATTSTSLSAGYTVNPPAAQQQCIDQSMDFRELRVTLVAYAVNYATQSSMSPEIVIRSFGPDRLRVATFNVWNPKNHLDSVFIEWGRTLGRQADVLLLQEIPDRRRAELIADAANMPYVVVYQDGFYADIAIASRRPLYNINRVVVDDASDTFPGLTAFTSNDTRILSAFIDINNYPHQFIVSHWATRTRGDLYEREVSSPNRKLAARKTLSMMSSAEIPIFVGGDFNAVCSLEEINILLTALIDPYFYLGLSDNCNEQIIDYVLTNRVYRPVQYQELEGDPSDHEFIVTEFASS